MSLMFDVKAVKSRLRRLESAMSAQDVESEEDWRETKMFMKQAFSLVDKDGNGLRPAIVR